MICLSEYGESERGQLESECVYVSGGEVYKREVIWGINKINHSVKRKRG